MYLLGSFTTQQTNLFFFQLQKERIHDVVAYMDGLLQAYWMYMLCTLKCYATMHQWHMWSVV